MSEPDHQPATKCRGVVPAAGGGAFVTSGADLTFAACYSAISARERRIQNFAGDVYCGDRFEFGARKETR
jgi:hypothetical protein